MTVRLQLLRRLTRQYDERYGQAVAINAVWFGVSFLWNAIHPILLPVLLVSHTATAQNTYYGLLTFGGLVVAMLVQPLSGALSDHTVHPLGKRRPWMLLGLSLGLVCLWVMVLAPNMWVLACGYVLLQFSSNLLHGASQGLIPDLMPAERHGLASGFKNLLDMLGVVAAALVISRVTNGAAPRLTLAAGLISAVWAGGTLCTVCGIVEHKTLDAQRARPQLKVLLHDVCALRVRGQGDYARLLLSRFCVLLGTYMVQSFAFFYFEDVLHLPDPAKAVGDIMTMIGLAVMIAALPAGMLSERYGRRRLSLVAEGIVMAGMIGLALWHSAGQLWLLGSIIGLGMGIFVSVNWAWATDLVPADEPAKYLGLSNLATAGAAATSRLMGPLIDLVNAQRQNAGYSMLFVIAIIGVGLALAITRRVRETR